MKTIIRRIVASVSQYHELAYWLTVREVKGRYKQSLLGYAWAIFQPLSLMLVFTVVFSKVVKISSEGLPYPVFVYCGILPWTFFSSAVTNATVSITQYRNIIQKIYFPRIVIPVAAVMGSFFDLLVALTIFMGLLLYYKVSFSLLMLWAVPIFILQCVLTLACAFITSCLNVFYRDVKNAIGILLQLMMFCTPVIYSLSIVSGRHKAFLLLNPMTGIIVSYRNVILHGMSPNWSYLLLSFAETAILAMVGYAIFTRLENYFADYI